MLHVLGHTLHAVLARCAAAWARPAGAASPAGGGSSSGGLAGAVTHAVPLIEADAFGLAGARAGNEVGCANGWREAFPDASLTINPFLAPPFFARRCRPAFHSRGARRGRHPWLHEGSQEVKGRGVPAGVCFFPKCVPHRGGPHFAGGACLVPLICLSVCLSVGLSHPCLPLSFLPAAGCARAPGVHARVGERPARAGRQRRRPSAGLGGAPAVPPWRDVRGPHRSGAREARRPWPQNAGQGGFSSSERAGGRSSRCALLDDPRRVTRPSQNAPRPSCVFFRHPHRPRSRVESRSCRPSSPTPAGASWPRKSSPQRPSSLFSGAPSRMGWRWRRGARGRTRGS